METESLLHQRSATMRSVTSKRTNRTPDLFTKQLSSRLSSSTSPSQVCYGDTVLSTHKSRTAERDKLKEEQLVLEQQKGYHHRYAFGEAHTFCQRLAAAEIISVVAAQVCQGPPSPPVTVMTSQCHRDDVMMSWSLLLLLLTLRCISVVLTS